MIYNMIPNITVMRWYFLVQISKALMKAKRTLPGGLIVPDTDESGEHSLCYGTIVQIGKDAKGNDYANQNFPQAQLGDTIILHHWVEVGENYGDPNDPDFIYVLVNDDGHNIKGVEKADGTIIPHPVEVWCSYLKKEEKVIDEQQPGKIELENWKPSESGLLLFDGTFDTDTNIMERIQDVEMQSKYMAETQQNEVTVARMKQLQHEGEQLTKDMNKRVVYELELLLLHPRTEKESMKGAEKGDHLFCTGWVENAGYNLNYKGTIYTLVKLDNIIMALQKSFLMQRTIENIVE